MQDCERKIPIYFWVKRSKVKVTTELCQHFCSDTITGVVFNVQLSYFIHKSGWREKDTFLDIKVKGYGHKGTLSTLWFLHYNLSSFNRTAFIFHT